jgi:hypothetical protein
MTTIYVVFSLFLILYLLIISEILLVAEIFIEWKFLNIFEYSFDTFQVSQKYSDIHSSQYKKVEYIQTFIQPIWLKPNIFVYSFGLKKNMCYALLCYAMQDLEKVFNVPRILNWLWICSSNTFTKINQMLDIKNINTWKRSYVCSLRLMFCPKYPQSV